MAGDRPTPSFRCANCQSPGNSSCKNCRLVVYCGSECQKAHWEAHKKWCKCALMKDNWQPQWATEKRMPSFVNDGPSFMGFGGKKFYYGNVPAYDVLCLAKNEGDNYDKDLNLLFAASGDLRNVIGTIIAMPEDYKKSTTCVINDRDIDIVARNLIILLIALTTGAADDAATAMIHIWYLASVRDVDVKILNEAIKPLIQDIVQKVANKISGTILGKTWTFGSSSLRVVLPKEKWSALLAYFEVPTTLTASEADRIRTGVTLAKERMDHLDRARLQELPTHRVCATRYREDGMLLPFSYSREEFQIPNPTFFQTKAWPMKDAADPLHGYDITEVLRTSSGAATNDVYGKLYHLLIKQVSAFHRSIRKRPAHFVMHNQDAAELPEQLAKNAFDRIEVANISDGAYLGYARTVALLGPLLRSPAENSKATLITLFMNAVHESTNEMETTVEEVMRVAPFVKALGWPLGTSGEPTSILLNSARPLVRDVDKAFAKYMERLGFAEFEQLSGMFMKAKHSIVEKWPMKLKLQPQHSGALEEFKSLLSSGHTGTERYVEWKRDATVPNQLARHLVDRAKVG